MICEEILKESPMSKPVTVEIVAIGSEILIGDVQDINTHWLCKEITSAGSRREPRRRRPSRRLRQVMGQAFR